MKEGVALDITLDSVVLSRMKQFAQMNKLKKMALMVVGQNLSPDDVEGAPRCAGAALQATWCCAGQRLSLLWLPAHAPWVNAGLLQRCVAAGTWGGPTAKQPQTLGSHAEPPSSLLETPPPRSPQLALPHPR